MIVTVQAKNFLSWETLDFNIQSGVTLIDGWNADDQTSEGSGKSAILNAISWCLYGKLPKDAKIDDVIKRGESSCVVAVRIDSTTVVRSRKPHELCLIGQDGHVIKGKDAKETQDLIEAFVGLTFETFCQTVYFAQNYPKKFITANQEEKGKILSEVQDLTAFDRARKEVVELIKKEESTQLQLKNNIELLARDISGLEYRAQLEEHKLKSALDTHTKAEETVVASIESLQEECLELQASLDELAQTEVMMYDETVENALKLQSQQLMGQQMTIKNDLLNVDKTVRARISSEARGKMLAQKYQDLARQKELNEEFIKNPTSICPTCNSTLENCDTTKAASEVQNIEATLASYMDELNALSAELDVPMPDKDVLIAERDRVAQTRLKVDVELARAQSTREQVISSRATMKSLDTQLNTRLATLKKSEAQLEHLRSNPPLLDTAPFLELKAQGARFTEQRQDLIRLVGEKQIHVNRLELLKDGFKEIKSFVFNSMLNEINAKVHQYLSHLFEVQVSVRFRNDAMKIETDVVFDGEERGLGLLSGGQFRRVSLAVDLALADVITARKGAKLGVLILDEYFKDLSESSMEKCLALLEGRGQPVLLIEHNSIFKNIVNNTFFVKLQEGTSRAEL